MKRALIALLLFAVLTSPTLAQEPADLACTDEDVQTAVDEVRTALDQAEGLIGEDPTGALNALAEARAQLALIDATCRGLAFDGTGQDIIGPFDLPAGVYIATFAVETGERRYIVYTERTILEGDCDYITLSARDEAPEDNAVIESAGCRILIEVDNSAGLPWTLTFATVE